MKPWTETRLLSDEQFTADLWAAFWEVVGPRAELLPWVEIGEVRAPVEPQLTT